MLMLNFKEKRKLLSMKLDGNKIHRIQQKRGSHCAMTNKVALQRTNKVALQRTRAAKSHFKMFKFAKNSTNVEQAFMAMAAEIKNRMASQPMNNARPPTVQIRGHLVNQKSGCCSS